VLVTSNAGNGYENAGLIDVASKKITWLTSDKWEISSGKFSPDGKSLTWIANVDGNQDIVVFNLASKHAHALPLPKGINSLAGAEAAFSHDGTHLLFTHNGPNAPNDIWDYDFAAQKSLQITHSLVGGCTRGRHDRALPGPLPQQRRQVADFRIRLCTLQCGKEWQENAAVVSIHGGPTAQAINSFSRSIQYLVNQGFFVIAPNYRGSTGYGKEFEDANRFDMGGGDLEDVISAAEWIKKTGFIDPKKLP